ncbi:MAG TPA: hypothetical protein VE988_15350 [Gemmataceae bacterium]|nr:hypothetical protein [Gemmataceae bacterium]
MMTQDELERDRYESRLKMQRDISAALADARREGAAQAVARGRAQELSRYIRSCQRWLRLAETPESQLRVMQVEELERLAQQLENEMNAKLGKS